MKLKVFLAADLFGEFYDRYDGIDVSLFTDIVDALGWYGCAARNML
jgi:hypothetical protein